MIIIIMDNRQEGYKLKIEGMVLFLMRIKTRIVNKQHQKIYHDDI